MLTKSQINSVRDSDLIFVVNPKLKEYPHLPTHNGGLTQEPRNQQSHAGILRAFFTFAYCLCVCPFRIVRESDGTNTSRKWIVQSAACVVVTVAALFTRFGDIRKAFPSKDEQWNPVVYFRIFHTICSLGLSFNAWWSLWRKSDRFVEVVEYIDSTKALPALTPTKISRPTIAAIVCAVYAILGFVSALLGSELMDSGSWTPNHWGRCLVAEARYQFFTGPESKCNNSTMMAEVGDISSADHFIAGITGFGQFAKYITAFYWELLILLGVLCLWLPAESFANFVKDDRDDEDDDDDEDDARHEERVLEAAAQWPIIEEQYLSLKDLSDLINNAFGAMVFSYTFTSIFYYSINLDAFLLTTDILVRIRLVVLYVGAVILYILAADVCRQVSYLEIWLSEYADDETKSNVPFHRLTVILNELSTSTIGITGWNVFTITYSVVANMTSVLITYFIICVQFRTPNK